MPRLVHLVLCMLLALFLFGCEQTANVPSQKIGLVNINRILVDSEPGRQAAKYMENLQEKLREEATKLQKKAQTLAEKENKDGANEEEEKLQKEIQMGYLRLQNKMQAEQQNVNSILNDVVHRVVEK